MTSGASPSPTPESLRLWTTSAARMRRHRDRRRKGLRCIPFEIRETEIAQLVHRGLLLEADRDDPVAIAKALGKLLDQWLR